MKKILVLFFLAFVQNFVHAQNPLTVPHGGTFRVSLDSTRLLVGANKSAVISLSNSSADSMKFLRANGVGILPTWETVTGGGGMTNPMTTLGDIIYENAAPTPARLAGNTTTTQKYLTQTGTGAISAVPAWFTFDLNNLLTVSDGINISGTSNSSGTGSLLGIDANGISLGKLAQIADQTLLGNVSGSTGDVTAIPLADISDSIIQRAIITNPLTDTRNTIAPLTDKKALTIISGGTSNILELKDNSANLHGVVNSAGFLQLGTNSSDISASTPFKIWQLAGDAAMIVKAASGADIIQIKDAASAVNTVLDINFNFGTLGKLGAGTITPSFPLHIFNPTPGNITSYVTTAGGATLSTQDNFVQTTNGSATLLHAYTTTTNAVQHFYGYVKARRTNGGGAGNGASYRFAGMATNKAGVLTLNVYEIITTDNIGVPIISVIVGAINTTDIEVTVTGAVGFNIDWTLADFKVF